MRGSGWAQVLTCCRIFIVIPNLSDARVNCAAVTTVALPVANRMVRHLR